MSKQAVVIPIGSDGVGRTKVPFNHMQMERVRIEEIHGVPHIYPGTEFSWIEVLGAVPDSEVTVNFHVEGD